MEDYNIETVVSIIKAISTISEYNSHPEIHNEEEISTDVVSVGIKVKVLDIDMEEEEVYSLVGSEEANPMENKISDESPVGKALLGAKVNDIVTVASPNGEYELKILEISK